MKTVKNIFYYLALPALAITVLAMSEHKRVAIFPIVAVAFQTIVDIYLQPASSNWK